jgi:hypothetical protein
MTRQFSIPTVLRMAPNVLLKELFAEMDYAQLGRDWEGMGERQIDPVQRAISMQPPEVQARIESEFRDLFDLACDSGIASICEAADLCGMINFAAQLPEEGLYHKVLWTRLHHPDVFERALRIHSFEVLNWWRKRNDLPSRVIEVSDTLKDHLARELSALFGRTQGRGYPCTVEHFGRGNATEYFYAHPDDFAQEAMCHDEARQLTPMTIRPTFSVVFAYNHIEGSLELHAKVPAKLKRQLEQLFADIVLETELGPWEPDAAYDLDHLKDRSFSLATDPEDRVRVQIRAMRFSGRNTGRRNTVELSDDEDNIHDAVEEWINKRNVSFSQVHATKVTFRFQFLELDGRKPGTETFDVTWPSSCNLRGRRPERVEIIEKYLKRWKIDVSKPVILPLTEVEPEPAGTIGQRVTHAS